MSHNASHIYQTDVDRAKEGYLTFWFDPHGAVIPDLFTWRPPDNLISIASVVGVSWWPPPISLYPAGEAYKVYMAWPSD
jgi:hypothetical protein